MKKIILTILVFCLTFGWTLSASAAEARAEACLDRNCPGFLRSNTVDEPLEDSLAECPLGYGCIITYKDRVAHIRQTFCSECKTIYKKELLGITQTQTHSRLH